VTREFRLVLVMHNADFTSLLERSELYFVWNLMKRDKTWFLILNEVRTLRGPETHLLGDGKEIGC